MAHFYGSLQGSRGRATRCGTKSSGITASVQSWDGSVTMKLWTRSDGVTMLTVSSRDDSGVGGHMVWNGTLKALVDNPEGFELSDAPFVDDKSCREE